MIEWQWPWLALLAPIPFLLRWLLPPKQAAISALRYPDVQAFDNAAAKPGKKYLVLIIGSLIWLLLVAAATRPQWLGDPLPVRNEGRELMLAVDLSGSMEIADMTLQGERVDRLTMLKHVMGDFIARRKGDRLGLILFADTAFLQTPMTYDLNTVQQMLNESVLGLVGQRTAIGDAIALAVKRFKLREKTNRVLILLTDGQNTAGNVTPEQALELAKAFDVKVYTIGVGAEEVVVDGFFGQTTVNPSRDLNESLLKRIANETGGDYFRARSTQELEAIYRLLDQYEPVEGNTQQLRPRSELFYWPLSAALILSLLLAGGFCLLRRATK